MDKINYDCPKILPLVYDESLSYYEVLCKLVDKVNDVIDFKNLTLITDMKYSEDTEVLTFYVRGEESQKNSSPSYNKEREEVTF